MPFDFGQRETEQAFTALVWSDKILQVLIRARARLSDPRCWCKGQYSKVSPQGWNQYCLMGAVIHGGIGTAVSGALVGLVNVIRSEPAPDSISMFNDAPETTHADVLEALDKAIANRIKRLTS